MLVASRAICQKRVNEVKESNHRGTECGVDQKLPIRHPLQDVTNRVTQGGVSGVRSRAI